MINGYSFVKEPLSDSVYYNDFQYGQYIYSPHQVYITNDSLYEHCNYDRSLWGGGGVTLSSPPGKKGFENLLKKYGYDKPHSTKCKLKGPFGTWTWVPCIKNETIVTGVYFGFNYPANVTKEQETVILDCGYKAAYAGLAIITAAANPIAAIAAVPAANATFREVLKKCLENTGLTHYIISNTQGGIYTKRIS